MWRFLLAMMLSIMTAAVIANSNDVSPDDVIVLEEGRVWQGDYFASGSSIELSGTVTGDAYIAAAQVIIDGVVEGDVLLLCGSADISGHVLGSVRVLAGQLSISGQVDRHVTAIAANVVTAPTSQIGSSVLFAACNADMQGVVNSDAKLLISNLRSSSKIDGEVSAYVKEMRITSKSYIGGSLIYRSAEPAKIDENATIIGGVEYHPSLFNHIVDHPWLSGIIIGSKFVTLIMNFVFTFVFGLIVLRLFPSKTTLALDALDMRPVKCLGVGVSAIILLPLVSLMLLISVIGAPFAIALIALNIFGFYTAKLFVVLWLFSLSLAKCRIKTTRSIALFLGLIAYYVIAAIPYIGPVAVISSVLLGTGAIILAQSERRAFLPFFRR